MNCPMCESWKKIIADRDKEIDDLRKSHRVLVNSMGEQASELGALRSHVRHLQGVVLAERKDYDRLLAMYHAAELAFKRSMKC